MPRLPSVLATVSWSSIQRFGVQSNGVWNAGIEFAKSREDLFKGRRHGVVAGREFLLDLLCETERI